MLKNDTTLFLILLGFVIGVIYIIFFVLTIISLFEKSKIKYYNIIVSIMRYTLPIICFALFGQIFEFLIIIYLCVDNKDSIKYNSFKCPNNYCFYVFSVLSAIAIIFLLIISYLTISIFYKPPFMKDKNDSLKKITSRSDLVFFLNKIIFIVLTNIDYHGTIFIWFVLIILFLSTFGNMICFTKYNNYENILLKEINKYFSVLLFSLMTSLMIGKIFNAWEFSGALYIFVIGLINAIMSAFIYKSGLNSYSNVKFKELNSSCECLLYIKDFLELIKNRHLCRETLLKFDTLILIREENCIDKNCKLKKYIKSREKGEANDFILFQYCQSLYEIAIKKFPDDVILKVNYITYLIITMSKRKLAEKVLYTVELKTFQFESNFLFFCCKKFIQTHSLISEHIFKEENKNVMKKLEYDKLNEEFKNDLSQASSLYYEFWQTLNKYHMQGVEDFDRLKNIGKELNILINKIENNFETLHNVRGDDTSLLYLYSGFIKYILDDKTKYDNLKHILLSISNVDKIKDFEIDYTNFDSKFYEQSDEHKYIMISAEEENLGTIINISHSACNIFGYTKNELLGQKFSMLLPDICQKEFENYLHKHTNKLKIKFYDTLAKKVEYFPQIDELFISGQDKSKYIVPIYIKMLLVQTEESDHAYIMLVSYLEDINLNKFNELFYMGSIINPNIHKEEKLYKYCVVLTDNNFIIRTFTANCREHLGLDTHSINNNIDLTQFISEFNENVDEMLNKNKKKLEEKSDKNDIKLISIEDSNRNSHQSEIKSNVGLGQSSSSDKKLIFKRYIAEKNYFESKLITWKSEAFENFMINNRSNIDSTNIVTTGKRPNLISENTENKKEKLFLLVIRQTVFNNKQVGYTFLFRREKVSCIENTDNNIKSSISNSNMSLVNDNKNKKIFKAHKTTFSTFKSSDNLKVYFDKDNKDTKEMKDNKGNKNKKGNEDNNKLETKKEVKHSKSQKRIMKMPKSLDAQKAKQNGNIVGIIQSKIKNILKEDSSSNDSPLKKTSFKNFSSQLSLVNDKKYLIDKEEDESFEFPDKISDKKLVEKTIKYQNFVPKCNFNFTLDMKLMSYRPSYNISKTNSFNNILKEEATKKINQFKQLTAQNQNAKAKNNDSSFYSSSEEKESYENEENSSSLTISDSKKKLPKKTIEKKKEKKSIKEDLDKEYYRVSGLSKIKFMIFDFEQEMVIEKEGQKENKSEVENILINHKLKLPTVMDKDGNDPSVKVNKLLLKYSNKDLTKDKLIRINSTSQIQNAKKIKKQKESCKRLETELNKKDKEISIILYQILCFFLNLVLLGMGGFSLYFVVSQLKAFKNNLLLIIYASLLRHYTNLGIYHTRMYIITKIDIPQVNYTNFKYVQNKTEYLDDLLNKLNNDYFSGAEYLEKMIAMDVSLSEENEKKLYLTAYNNTIINNNYLLRNVSVSHMVGIAEIYSHFYYLLINIKNIEYNSPEVLNFIINALNNAGIGMNEIIDVYIDEIKNKKKHHTTITYIMILVYLVILIIIFFVIRINYVHIIIKRDNYISTFYQINLSFINTSILKCEKFLNRLNPNELITNKDANKDALDNSVSISDFDDNLLSNESMKKSINNKPNAGKMRKCELKTKTNVKLILTFMSFLLVIYLYLMIPLIEFDNYISKFKIMANYMQHMLHFHNNIINIFNSFNEYLFYSLSTVENIPTLEFLEKTINNTFDTIVKDINYQANYAEEIPGLNDIFLKIQKEKLCSTNICEPYIETITSLGYFNFVTFWIIEVKNKLNYANALEGSRRYKELWKNNQELRLLSLFNTLHFDIDYMFNFVILHYVELEISITVEKIFENINSRNNMYITVFTVFMIFIVILYFFYWNPFITETQDQIYKTKLTLNIIPVEILESQTNIKMLLGISDLNE